MSTSPRTPSIPESPQPQTGERIERLRSDVMTILANLSGAALSTAESSTTFLELGFDSLFLAQVSIALQKQFGVKITFRQLLNDFSSVETLAAHLDGVLPRDVPAHEKSAPRRDRPLRVEPNREKALSANDGAVASVPAHSPLQTLMQEQLRSMNELFARQLEAIEKSGEAFVSNALIAGKYALRVCIVNFRASTSDIEAMPRLITDLGRQIHAELSPA